MNPGWTNKQMNESINHCEWMTESINEPNGTNKLMNQMAQMNK